MLNYKQAHVKWLSKNYMFKLIKQNSPQKINIQISSNLEK